MLAPISLMKRSLSRALCFLLVFILFLLRSSGGVSSESEISRVSYTNSLGNRYHTVDQPPARRSLLSHSDEHDTVLVASLDGKINLVDPKSATILWSFTSGPPIYSSYQAPVNHDLDKENISGSGGSYFVDCGDDWKLFAHTDLGKVNLDLTAEEFFRITPHIAEDGVVVLGSKKTSVFLVDAKTGRLMRTYMLSDSPFPSSNNEIYNIPIEEWEKSGTMRSRPDELPLYITRTDYLLKSFGASSGEVLWNVTVADIGAAFLCQDIDNTFTGAHFDVGNDLPSETGVGFNMPLSCHSKAVVFRLRSPRVLDSFSLSGRLTDSHHQDRMLPEPSGSHMIPFPTKGEKKFQELYYNNDNDVGKALSLPAVTQDEGMSGINSTKMPYNNELNRTSGGPGAFILPVLLIIIGSFTTFTYFLVTGKSIKHQSIINAKMLTPRRKKVRKSGKNSRLVANKNKKSSDEDERKSLLNFNQMIDGDRDGRTVGKVFVTVKEIAKGSNGTVVLEGFYEGRPVAVKRLVRSHHDVAIKEIENLIASDRHPNIVRWYGVEEDQDFIYLALERCTCSLNNLIQIYSDCFEMSPCLEGQATKALVEHKARLDSVKSVMPDIVLWKANGYPSPTLLKLMRDVVSGLVHLHDLGIIHRDLKPQNVLIMKGKSLCAKLSDMGISKQLVGDMSSVGCHATGYGSSGWQAPEQLLQGRQTRAVDVFSLGCVLFFCITGGRHPFGNHLERDINVTQNRVNLFLVTSIPEAVDLFSRLLDPCAELRPKAVEVLHHPLFWSSEIRLSFLRDTSDRVELEDKEGDILKALESVAPLALGGKWDEKMEPAFIVNIGRYRRYKYDSVRDLLRVIRNKLNHFRELPKEIQELLGPVPNGFDDYFASRFPRFLIEVYKVMYNCCKEEEWYRKYSNSNVV